ncbi:hypothetical protein OS128_10460 [Corynebacterium sp. P5848]|uniref:hypothetical protein n=1 Tax=Corynebacterium marambiense TaxID=2765364 RepID=UPI002260C03E|nr:hypothetical protein [Corynebacterium marambiense]MCX7543335.1 hypothetical protein [Corynebacterium marambiense]
MAPSPETAQFLEGLRGEYDGSVPYSPISTDLHHGPRSSCAFLLAPEERGKLYRVSGSPEPQQPGPIPMCVAR